MRVHRCLECRPPRQSRDSVMRRKPRTSSRATQSHPRKALENVLPLSAVARCRFDLTANVASIRHSSTALFDITLRTPCSLLCFPCSSMSSHHLHAWYSGWIYGAAWTSMSLFSGHDSKMVYRSASFLGYPSFRYKQVLAHKVKRNWRRMTRPGFHMESPTVSFRSSAWRTEISCQVDARYFFIRGDASMFSSRAHQKGFPRRRFDSPIQMRA